jgi:ABC-type transport system involved in multi-copper enzyme maturation permease subunit
MKAIPLAFNTLKEAIRDKILYVILVFALLMLMSSILLSTLSLSSQDKIVMDLGLSAISIFGVIITVFLGTNLLHKEIDKKTVFLLLPKPISRSDFILGKYIGMCLTQLIITLAMGLAFYGVLAFVAPTEVSGLFGGTAQALILIYLELMVLNAVAVFFSTFATPIMSAVFTIATYVIGHLSNDVISFGKLSGNPALAKLTEGLFYVLPDLERMNLKNQIMATGASSEVMLGSIGYGLLYAASLLVLSILIFDGREF